MFLKNVLVAIILALIYGLALWPSQLRDSLEQRPDYPQGVWIAYADSLAPSYPPNPQAKQTLEVRLRNGDLALESSVFVFAQKLPKIYLSSSALELGLVRLIEGTFEDTEGTLLGQLDGPYRVGDSTAEGTVTGIVEIAWSQVFVTDAVVLQGIQDDLSRLPAVSRSGTRFYFRPESDQDLQETLRLIQGYTGSVYTSLPLYEFLARDVYALEARQVKLQQFAVLFLLVCMLLFIYSNQMRAWFQAREIYRTERVLGRSRGYFLRQWFLTSIGQWLWGVSACTLLFLGIVAARYGFEVSLFSLLFFWWLAITLFGLATAFAFSLLSSRFPLARSSLDNKRTWADNVTPVFVSFVIVFGVSYLFADTLTQWLESAQSIRALGSDQVVALTTPAADKALPSNLCEGLDVRACASFGIANIDLWPPELAFLKDEDDLSTSFRFDPEDAGALRIELTEGRFPKARAKEVLMNERTLEKVRAYLPEFGVGSKLDLGYTVVGTVRTPTHAKYAIFDSVYRAPVLIHKTAPDFEPEYFLSPLGESGLLISLDEQANLGTVKAAVRNRYRDVEFIQPAAYAQVFARVIRGSLLRLTAIFVVAGVLALLVYQNLIAVIMVKRRLEISVWRLLGMSISSVLSRLQRSLIPLPLFTGLFACATGVLLLFYQHRNSVAFYALVCGLVVTLLMVLGCLWLLKRNLKPLKQEISEVYRRAL